MPRLLIVKLSSLGDLIHALPAVRDLRRGLNATVDWVTQSDYAALARCFSDVDEIITFPRQNFLVEAARFARPLRRSRYDLIVDLQGLLKSALLVARLARGDRRVGPGYSREGARWLYSDRAPPGDPDRHAVEQALDVVRHLGVAVGNAAFPIRFPDYPLSGPSPRVAFIPCSRWPAKNWPAEQFIDLGRKLQEQAGATLYLVGGPGDQSACRNIEVGLAGRVVNLCGRTSLVELGGALKTMNLVVSVDSGPMHMAAACNVPVLAIFGVTDPRRTGPYGAGHRVVLADEFKNHPELARAYKSSRRAGRWHVPTEEVARHALDMLA
jgi:heptosyltransferase-1